MGRAARSGRSGRGPRGRTGACPRGRPRPHLYGGQADKLDRFIWEASDKVRVMLGHLKKVSKWRQEAWAS